MFGCLENSELVFLNTGSIFYTFLSVKRAVIKTVIKVSRNKERKIQQIRYTFVCVHTRLHTSTSVHKRLQRNAKSGMNCVNCINRIQQHKLDELDELTVYKRARTRQNAFQI